MIILYTCQLHGAGRDHLWLPVKRNSAMLITNRTQLPKDTISVYIRMYVYVIIEASAEARVHRMTSYKHTNVLEVTVSLNASL